jgi:hypothetical protein
MYALVNQDSLGQGEPARTVRSPSWVKVPEKVSTSVGAGSPQHIVYIIFYPWLLHFRLPLSSCFPGIKLIRFTSLDRHRAMTKSITINPIPLLDIIIYQWIFSVVRTDVME